jgi:taurine dioxygenase
MSAVPDSEVDSPAAFRTVPFDAPLGAVIEGIDLSRPIADDVFAQLRAAYAAHSVLVFPDQRLEPEAHIRFSRGFGKLAVHVVAKYLLPGHPEIFRVSNIVENGQRIGGSGEFWHTDLSYVAEPSRGSLLYAVEVPTAPDGTVLGDTQFASTAAAYEALAPELKERLDGLVGIHRFGDIYAQVSKGRDGAAALTAEQKARTPDVMHPVVVRHPESGRRSLFVNQGFTVGIVGMTDDESAPLLRTLFDHMTQPRFTYTHRWRLGDLVMWDNWATVHRAMGGYTAAQRRLMHRTTLDATVPFAQLAA